MANPEWGDTSNVADVLTIPELKIIGEIADLERQVDLLRARKAEAQRIRAEVLKAINSSKQASGNYALVDYTFTGDEAVIQTFDGALRKGNQAVFETADKLPSDETIITAATYYFPCRNPGLWMVHIVTHPIQPGSSEGVMGPVTHTTYRLVGQFPPAR